MKKEFVLPFLLLSFSALANNDPATQSDSNSTDCIQEYFLPNDGAWYQLQEKSLYTTICHTSGPGVDVSPCSVSAGTYQLVEFRKNSIVVNDIDVHCGLTSETSALSQTSTLSKTRAHQVFGDAKIAVSATNSAIDVRVGTARNSPARVYYRLAGETSWLERLPSEDSSKFGNQIPHKQTISALAPGQYEVYVADHINNSYQTEIVSVSVSNDLTRSITIGGNSVPFGEWTEQNWLDIMGGLSSVHKPVGMGHLSIVNDGGSHKIRQRHTASSRGSDRVIAGFHISDSEHISIKQTIEVAENFSWGRSSAAGKFGFGFGGGANTSGGAANPAGFTLRPAWYGDGELTLYSYAANRDNGGNARYGQYFDTGFRIERGVPFTIQVEAQINSSFSSADGWAKLWVNDKQVLDIKNIAWQTRSYTGESRPHFDRINWSQFHGGADSSFSPTQATWVQTSDVSYEVW